MAIFKPADYEHLIGKYYRKDGYEYKLMGILYGEDDWYWVMGRGGRFDKYTQLLSCVGCIENFDFELIDKLPEEKQILSLSPMLDIVVDVDRCSEEAGNSKLNFKDEKD